MSRFTFRNGEAVLRVPVRVGEDGFTDALLDLLNDRNPDAYHGPFFREWDPDTGERNDPALQYDEAQFAELASAVDGISRAQISERVRQNARYAPYRDNLDDSHEGASFTARRLARSRVQKLFPELEVE